MLAPVHGIASFHLVREQRALRALSRLGTDRVRLRSVDGLRFWRLLGTGAASHTGPGVDPHRSALFALWDDEGDLDRFMERMAERWAGADESWHVRLRAAGGHGSWRGVEVLTHLQPARAAGGPVAIITRADVRVRSWRAFRAVGPAISDELQTADGLLDVVAIGEAPAGRQGTFSLWRDVAAARAFAHRLPEHAAVVRRTRTEQWYGEEMFARFEPYDSTGTWDGRDPLRTGTSIP
jgi:hypothetical protein